MIRNRSIPCVENGTKSVETGEDICRFTYKMDVIKNLWDLIEESKTGILQRSWEDPLGIRASISQNFQA
ncbi:hypothetical protein SUGI_0423820 [Cryptomeria japonica]|nr:hypothetical protein SUGI_0423820 [Cryptomeria japonica]